MHGVIRPAGRIFDLEISRILVSLSIHGHVHERPIEIDRSIRR